MTVTNRYKAFPVGGRCVGHCTSENLCKKTVKVGIMAFLPMDSTKFDKRIAERDHKTAHDAHGPVGNKPRIIFSL